MATQIFYKDGAKWVVNQYRLDSGSCLAVESDNGLMVSIKLKSNLTTVAYGYYTDFVDETETAYTKATLLAVLDPFINGASQANGTPVSLEVEITRPDDTTAYTANDAIGEETTAVKQVSVVTLTGTGGSATITGTDGISRTVLFNTSLTQTATDFATAYSDDYTDITVTGSGETIVFTADNYDQTFIEPVITNVSEDLTGTVDHTTANVVAVAQKETITVSGTASESQSETITLTGTAPTIETWTVPLAGTLPAAQVEIITITGTSGNFTVETLGGFVNYAWWDTSADQTALNFVDDHAAEYLTVGVVVTASTNTIIFTAEVPGVPFTQPTTADGATDLHGAVANSVPNLAPGTANLNIVGLDDKLITFDTNLTTTANNFVTDHADYYLTQDITVTASTGSLTFESTGFGLPFGALDVTTLTGNLTNGTIVEDVAYIPIGTGTITGMGAARTVTFDTDVTTTALNFVTANQDDYLTGGVILDNSAGVLSFIANVSGTGFTSPAFVAGDGDLAGAYAEVQANVEVGTGTITAIGDSKLMTFDTDAATTVAAFETDNTAYYSGLGIDLTSSGDTIIFTAQVAGTGFTSPVFTNVTGDIAGALATTAPNYYANVVPVAQVETILVEGTEGEFTIGAAGGLTKVCEFIQSIAVTCNNFVNVNAAAYLAEGIVLSFTATEIIMTAEVPGTGFTAPTISGTTEDLAGTVVTTDMVSLLPLEFANAADVTGGGGIIMGLKLETNITAAAETDFRLWFFNDTPSGVVGDNVTYANLYANKSKLLFYVDVTMDALLGASDSVIGQVDLATQYTVADTSLYCMIQTVTGFTPTAEGALTVTLNVLKV